MELTESIMRSRQYAKDWRQLAQKLRRPCANREAWPEVADACDLMAESFDDVEFYNDRMKVIDEWEMIKGAEFALEELREENENESNGHERT